MRSRKTQVFLGILLGDTKGPATPDLWGSDFYTDAE